MTPVAIAVPATPDTVTDTVAEPAQARRALRLGLAVFAAAWLLLILTQYLLPPGYKARHWGLNLGGMMQFRDHLGLTSLAALSPATYSLLFRMSLLMLWSSYALVVLAAWQGAALRPRPLAAAILILATLTALFAPPLLSSDVYAYAAHGRLYALYDQNPYQCLPIYLAQVGDPVAHYLNWNWPTVYGPVWTRIEVGVVGLLHAGGLWPQIVGLKLVQAASLTAAALAGRRITQILSSGRENLTLLAIGLNPLLLLEGPGNGHNDLLMVSLLLIGAMYALEKKCFRAALFLGMAVGIKMVPLAVLPWILMEYGLRKSWPQRIGAIAVTLSVVLVPLAICYGSLWTGASTLMSAQKRAVFQTSASALAQDAAFQGWLSAHHLGPGLTVLLVALFHQRLVVAAYAGLTLWLWLRPAPGRWLLAWAALAAVIMLFALGPPFPWYVIWFWPILLLRWDRTHLALSAACFCLSLAWFSRFGLLMPGY